MKFLANPQRAALSKTSGRLIEGGSGNRRAQKVDQPRAAVNMEVGGDNSVSDTCELATNRLAVLLAHPATNLTESQSVKTPIHSLAANCLRNESNSIQLSNFAHPSSKSQRSHHIAPHNHRAPHRHYNSSSSSSSSNNLFKLESATRQLVLFLLISFVAIITLAAASPSTQSLRSAAASGSRREQSKMEGNAAQHPQLVPLEGAPENSNTFSEQQIQYNRISGNSDEQERRPKQQPLVSGAGGNSRRIETTTKTKSTKTTKTAQLGGALSSSGSDNGEYLDREAGNGKSRGLTKRRSSERQAIGRAETMATNRELATEYLGDYRSGGGLDDAPAATSGRGLRRRRRHLVSSGPFAEAVEADQREQQEHRRRARSQHQYECQKLVGLWSYLNQLYPSLAGHLLSSASHSSGSNEQQLSASQRVWTKTLSHLLEEADRLVSESAAAASRPEATSALDSLAANSRQRNSWLTRVSSNPNYAKLVQYFQKQRQQRQQSSSHRNSGRHFGAHLTHERQLAAPMGEINAETGGAGGRSNINVVYGQVARYPHEMDENNAASRTLDKLRIIKAEQRRPEAEMSGSETGQQRATEEENSIASNKIPLIVGDGEPWTTTTTTSTPTATPAVAEVMRKNVVYGTERLGPGQMSNSISQQVDLIAGGEPINSLRQLSGEFSGNVVLATSGDHYRPAEHRHRHDETLGRELTDNPSVWVSRRPNGQQHQSQNTDSMLYKLRSHQQEAERLVDGQDPTLDELATQQARDKVSVAPAETGSDASGAAGSEETDNEFEGFFHQGPINQIEVRQIRSQREQASGGGDSNSKPNNINEPIGVVIVTPIPASGRNVEELAYGQIP